MGLFAVDLRHAETGRGIRRRVKAADVAEARLNACLPYWHRYGELLEIESVRPLGRTRDDWRRQTLRQRVADIAASTAFQRWFAGSRVLDANGLPQVVWHGSEGHFEAFDRRWIADPEQEGGFFFTASRNIAALYGAPRAYFLAIRHPYVMGARQWLEGEGPTAESIRASDYDGILIEPVDWSPDFAVPTWIAFEPQQIKAAYANNGSFDPDTGCFRK